MDHNILHSSTSVFIHSSSHSSQREHFPKNAIEYTTVRKTFIRVKIITLSKQNPLASAREVGCGRSVARPLDSLEMSIMVPGLVPTIGVGTSWQDGTHTLLPGFAMVPQGTWKNGVWNVVLKFSASNQSAVSFCRCCSFCPKGSCTQLLQLALAVPQL